MTSNNVFDTLRQPAYTGENRCYPCTVVNLLFAGLLAAIGGAVVGTVTTAAVAGGVGAGLFALATATIYVRGYLVPGTPTLTKRYFPARVLAWFGKAPETDTVLPDDLDIEATLRAAGVLEPCRAGGDLCLTGDFARAWRSIRADIEAVDVETGLALFLNENERDTIDRDAIELVDHGGAVVATVDERRVAQWESRAAFVADRAAASLLSERLAAWDSYGPTARLELVGSLRLWLDECPACQEPVAPGRDTVESCCRERRVVAIDCDNCDSRLFEVAYDGDEISG